MGAEKTGQVRHSRLSATLVQEGKDTATIPVHKRGEYRLVRGRTCSLYSLLRMASAIFICLSVRPVPDVILDLLKLPERFPQGPLSMFQLPQQQQQLLINGVQQDAAYVMLTALSQMAACQRLPHQPNPTTTLPGIYLVSRLVKMICSNYQRSKVALQEEGGHQSIGVSSP